MREAVVGEVGKSRPGIGQRRFVEGLGRYVDDLPDGDCLHVAFVRSPHAHARVRSVDRAAALGAPGVQAVVVGDELGQAAPIPVVRFTPDLKVPDYHALSGAVVHFVGESVAAVVADSPAGDVDGAFAAAAHVVTVRVVHHRISATPLEPRGVLARWDAGLGELTVWGSSQTPHQLRDDLAAALGLAQHRVRVVVPDLGGGFGAKGSTYREDIAVAALVRLLGRPVKWISTRHEDFLTTQHARDQVDEATAAVDGEGRILGIRTATRTNLG